MIKATFFALVMVCLAIAAGLFFGTFIDKLFTPLKVILAYA